MDFSNDIDMIDKACAKLTYLEYLILSDIANHKDPLSAGKDASGKRRGTIFFHTTRRVIITHHLLLTHAEFKDNVDVLQISSYFNTSAYIQVVETMEEDSSPNSHHDIFVAVSKVGLDGFNIQHITTVIFLDPPGTPACGDQAEGHLTRQPQVKQLMTTVTVENNNILDENEFSFVKRKKKAVSLIYGDMFRTPRTCNS